MSCPVFVDDTVLLGEDNCAWAKVTGRWTDQSSTGDTQGYYVSGTTYRIGAQHEIAPDWYLGASFGFGQREKEKQMSLRAVLFDLGGVIVRTEYQAPRQHLAERLGMEYDDLVKIVFDSDSGYQASIGAITVEEHWAWVMKRLKRPISTSKETTSVRWQTNASACAK